METVAPDWHNVYKSMSFDDLVGMLAAFTLDLQKDIALGRDNRFIRDRIDYINILIQEKMHGQSTERH